MHNNKAVFGQYKQHQAGFFEILKPSDNAAAPGTAAATAAAPGAAGLQRRPAGGTLSIKADDSGNVAAERKPPAQLDYPELYNLSVEDMHNVAAILATVLMMRKWKLQLTASRHVLTTQQVRAACRLTEEWYRFQCHAYVHD
jgi:hypothetical protein